MVAQECPPGTVCHVSNGLASALDFRRWAGAITFTTWMSCLVCPGFGVPSHVEMSIYCETLGFTRPAGGFAGRSGAGPLRRTSASEPRPRRSRSEGPCPPGRTSSHSPVTCSLALLASMLVAPIRTSGFVSVSCRPDCLRRNFAVPPSNLTARFLGTPAVKTRARSSPSTRKRKQRDDEQDPIGSCPRSCHAWHTHDLSPGSPLTASSRPPDAGLHPRSAADHRLGRARNRAASRAFGFGRPGHVPGVSWPVVLCGRRFAADRQSTRLVTARFVPPSSLSTRPRPCVVASRRVEPPSASRRPRAPCVTSPRGRGRGESNRSPAMNPFMFAMRRPVTTLMFSSPWSAAGSSAFTRCAWTSRR